MNLASDVNEDYPIVFNIILFIAIALILALIAVSGTLKKLFYGSYILHHFI